MIINAAIYFIFAIGFLKNAKVFVLANSTTAAAGRFGDSRRPVWNIAHMVNAAYQVDYYLDEGANTLEFDITFDGSGVAQFTYHGVPCDCFRSCTRYERFVPFLQYLRQLTTPSDPKFRKHFVLLFMDMKISSFSNNAARQAGTDIANKMLEHYWQRGTSGAVANVVLSLPSVGNYAFIEGYRNTLIKQGFENYVKKTGYDFSGNDDLYTIQRAYNSLNIKENIWQGDGITNCLPRGTSRLRECLSRRDGSGSDLNINKVYWWTVDKMSTMRSVLRLNVDGIITNYPDRFVRVLRESEFSGRFRMADIHDDPFALHSPIARIISNKMGRGGNISDIFSVKTDEEPEEMLDNYDPPDAEHWQMEANESPEPHLPYTL